MKKLLFFLATATIVGCTCIGQIPPQLIYVSAESCEAPLPDYRDQITVYDNCTIVDTIQIPLPGTILSGSNMMVDVIIVVTDNFGNNSNITFEVYLLDTISPTIIPDSSLLSYTPEERSDLLRAYHNAIGNDMYKAAQGEDSIWTYSMLRDTSYWEPNPWLDADSMFETKSMLMKWEPGFNASSVGSWVDADRYVLANVDSNHLKTLGLWPLMTVIFGPVAMPLTMDIAGASDNLDWLTQEIGGPVFKYVEAPWDLDDMYKSERYGVFKYKIPVGEGTFVVDLHFCEIYWETSGKRVFDVNIEGDRVLTDFDIFSEVGKWVPLVKTFTARVGFDGYLDIDFPIAAVDYGKLSGITIRKINGVQALLSSTN